MTERELTDDQKVLRGMFGLAAKLYPRQFSTHVSRLHPDDPMRSIAVKLIQDMVLPARVDAENNSSQQEE